MESDPVAYAVIGHAMKVHRDIGPGVDEVFYHRLLAKRLVADGVEHLFKPRQTLVHRGLVADVFEPDVVLPGKLVPELKVLVGTFEPAHFLQLRGYLKFCGIRQGLLFDFGKESLVIRSSLYEDPTPPRLDPRELVAGAPPTTDSTLIRALGESLVRVTATHGFGYRDTTYRGLVRADLLAEGIGCRSAPTALVCVAGELLGETILRRVLAVGESAVLVLSQREGIRAADRAVLQTALRLLELRWGVIVHFGKRELQLQWVLPARKRERIRGGS